MSFSKRIKNLDSNDFETIIADLGFEWEDRYNDYEQFHKAINRYISQNKEDEN